jgi:hypothetical protein
LLSELPEQEPLNFVTVLFGCRARSSCLLGSAAFARRAGINGSETGINS